MEAYYGFTVKNVHGVSPSVLLQRRSLCYGQKGLFIAVDNLAQGQVTITYAVKTADYALGL